MDIGLALGLLHHLVTWPLVILAVWFALELLTPRARSTQASIDEPGQIAVVIPAHNEAGGIVATIQDVRAQLRPSDRLLVVADNCSDNTAAVARAAGAEVIERVHPDQRGKGFALQYAIDHLRQDPPSVTVFTDADCFHEDGLIQAIASRAEVEKQPVQALYLMERGADAPPSRAVAAFAWLLMNDVRMRGLYALSGTTRLTGAGAAFPWAVIETRSLGTAEIVEDLALGLDLALDGQKVSLHTDHRVTSTFPSADDAAAVQRARWEHGSLNMISARVPKLLAAGLDRPFRFAVALDASIPPLMLFITCLSGAAASGIALAVLGMPSAWLPANLALAAAGISLIIAWVRYGQTALPPSELSGLIQFALMKFSVYGQKGKKSASSWTRTPREGEERQER